MHPHPHREALHHEVHARPHERLNAPLRLLHAAFVGAGAPAVRAHVNALLAARGLTPPDWATRNHLSVVIDDQGTRLRLEQHTEFLTLTFWRELAAGEAVTFAATPESLWPQAWLDGMPGDWLVGLHMLVVPGLESTPEVARLLASSFDEASLVGSQVMDGALVVTDFRLNALAPTPANVEAHPSTQGGTVEHGLGRWLVQVEGMNERRLGRAVQRLLEVETYRMMALLGLPAAREVGAELATAERDLATLAGEIRHAQATTEPELLQRLTDLAAQVEGVYARTHARFSASAAYFELVQQRIDELQETRAMGLQTLREFMDRRLAPAMQTCLWASKRQQALSERVARASNLLRTRVDIAQQQSSQGLLDAMNRRGRAQLLLQSAVEGLSVAAITYYGAGLVGYVAKGVKAAGWDSVEPDVAVAVSIPLIALAVWLGVRRLHRAVMMHA